MSDMSKEYRRRCRDCQAEIMRSLDEGGKWEALSSDGTLLHRCKQQQPNTQGTTPQNGKIAMDSSPSSSSSSSFTPMETKILKAMVAAVEEELKRK